jgi:hypothetical protein
MARIGKKQKGKLGKAEEAARGKLGKAEDVARALHDNQYLQAQYLHDLIEDEELRSSLLGAFESARKAYGRVSDGKPMSALADAHKLQREIKNTASALHDVGTSKRRHRGAGLKRSLLLIAITAVLALALSESLRSKVLDLMFGAEEEFDYSSTTTPVTPAPAPEAVAGS